MIVVVIRYETAATARWALTFIVRIFVNDTIAITVWTSFYHVVALRPLPAPADPWYGLAERWTRGYALASKKPFSPMAQAWVLANILGNQRKKLLPSESYHASRHAT